MIYKYDIKNYIKLTGRGDAHWLTLFVYSLHPRLWPVGIFRASAFFYRRRFKVLAQLFSIINQLFFGLEISPKVKIGKGLFIPHPRSTVIGALEIGENVTIYQNVTIGAKYLDFEYSTVARPVIKNNVIIGTGATILGPVTIGENTRIGPHCLVTKDLEPNTKYVLNPQTESIANPNMLIRSEPKLLNLRKIGDSRGLLTAIEEIKDIPFEIKRIYYIFNTKSGVRRGFHAHKNLNQIAIAVSGSCKFLVDDGFSKVSFTLDKPNQGLVLSGFLWREMYDFSEDCVLLVIADQYYDENDYIRDYSEFMKIALQR